MNDNVDADAADILVPTQRKLQIDVRNFGPIAAGQVEVRPLTIFVGPSNTGKTYLAILIYALHKALGGFQRLPLSHASVNFPYDLIGYRPGQMSRIETPEALKQQVIDLLQVVERESLPILICRKIYRITSEAFSISHLRETLRLSSSVALRSILLWKSSLPLRSAVNRASV